MAPYGVNVELSYDGNVIASTTRHGGVLIERADPRIRVSFAFLAALTDERPWARSRATFDGYLLVIKGDNAGFIYRVDAIDFERECYLMSWPD